MASTKSLGWLVSLLIPRPRDRRFESYLWSHCAMNFPNSLIESLRAAKKIVALTGAGISAESGLATFRDAQTGLWSRFKPEELATAEAFQRDPNFVQDWYAWRRENAL